LTARIEPKVLSFESDNDVDADDDVVDKNNNNNNEYDDNDDTNSNNDNNDDSTLTSSSSTSTSISTLIIRSMFQYFDLFHNYISKLLKLIKNNKHLKMQVSVRKKHIKQFTFAQHIVLFLSRFY
jgi:hypothetical protein